MSAAISAGAAILIGAGVAAAGTVAASEISSGATKSASNAAIGEEQQALTQQQQLNQPYNNVGQNAITQYQDLLGIGKGANSATTLAALQNTPGYQFTQQQGEQGILNQASAAGGVSGNTLTALDKYNTGLADQTYQNAVGNAQNAVGIGQAAAAGQSANIGQAAGNIGQIAINQGQTNAAIDSSAIAGLSKIGSNSLNQNTTLAALNAQNSPPTYNSQYSGQGSGGYVTQ